MSWPGLLPEIRAAHVEWSFYWPSFKKQEKEYQFDVTGFCKDIKRDGNPELWFVECKYWESRQVGIPQLKELLLKKEKFREAREYKGELTCWFCSKNKLNDGMAPFGQINACGGGRRDIN